MIQHPWLTPDGAPPPLIVQTDLPGVPLHIRGKVREVYDLDQQLLIVASDRVSAFDVVMNEPIPGKGVVLNAISAFWFERTGGIVPNHFITTDVDDVLAALARTLPSSASGIKSVRQQLDGRSMLVWKTERVDVECVVRGYLAGSAWAEYRRHGTMAGEPLPSDLVESQKLPRPLFTPATKAASGHDENIPVARMADLVGAELTAKLESISVELYRFGADYAARRGLILADTKFEFGLVNGEPILIDEALTPDSSRYWPADTYEPGHSQPSFDKQFLRDYLESTGWNKEPPPPPLPAEVIRVTSEKYREAYLRLTA